MGRSSDGTFDTGVTSAYSSSGRTETFGANAFDPRRTSRRDDTYTTTPSNYYDSYWNRPYSNNQRSWRSTQAEPRNSGYGFFIVFAFFAFFLSLWMLWGLYGSQEVEMGMYYSRVLQSKSLFVKEIKVQNLRDSGPVFYSFSSHPELGRPVSVQVPYQDFILDTAKPIKVLAHMLDNNFLPVTSGDVAETEDQDPLSGTDEVSGDVVDGPWSDGLPPSGHWCIFRFAYWLNKGSAFEISYDLESGPDSLVLAVVRGEDGYQEWRGDPSNPSLALKWQRIHGRGSFSFHVGEDDDYFIVFGNLNNRQIKLSLKMDVRYALYDKEKAALVCSTQIASVCKFPVPLGRSTFVLLVSPTVNTHGVDTWKAKVSYVPRWITYCFLWGLMSVALLFTKGWEIRHGSPQNLNEDQSPLVHGENEVHIPTQAPAEGLGTDTTPSAPPVSIGVDGLQREVANVPEDQLCTICLDARKDSFFDPCGHRCTCYSCGMRIQRENSGKCPICRQTIRTVRRIYDA